MTLRSCKTVFESPLLPTKMQFSSCVAPVARQRGVALAIVVWFIAGMSLLVAGIVSHARVDTQMAQLHMARAKVAAAGDGAIQLMMADLTTGKMRRSDQQGIPMRVYRVGDLEVEVSLIPASGLVSLNGSSAKVLAALFLVAGELEQGKAKTVADNVIKWRTPKGDTGRLRFASIEDLLRVDGVNRTMLDAVRDYVKVGGGASQGTDWSKAPETVLAVMQKADPQKAENAIKRSGRMRARSVSAPEGDEQVGASASSRGTYRADAVVRYGDKSWLRRRWVTSGGSRASSQLPWRMMRTEAPRVVDVNDKIDKR